MHDKLYVNKKPNSSGLHAEAILRDQFGNIKQIEQYYNTVTTAGIAGIVEQLMTTPSLGKPTHMAVGTGTGGTTALASELDRNALSTKTRAAGVLTMAAIWLAGDATGSITEAGIFDAASSGNMWLYATFGTLTKGASDTLSITWTLTIS